jgi:hypothetical protein
LPVHDPYPPIWRDSAAAWLSSRGAQIWGSWAVWRMAWRPGYAHGIVGLDGAVSGSNIALRAAARLL